MWITYLVFFLFLSLFYIGTGALMYKYPPKQVNNVLGYRTNMSMKNEETWKFANVYWDILLIHITICYYSNYCINRKSS